MWDVGWGKGATQYVSSAQKQLAVTVIVQAEDKRP